MASIPDTPITFMGLDVHKESISAGIRARRGAALDKRVTSEREEAVRDPCRVQVDAVQGRRLWLADASRSSDTRSATPHPPGPPAQPTLRGHALPTTLSRALPTMPKAPEQALSLTSSSASEAADPRWFVPSAHHRPSTIERARSSGSAPVRAASTRSDPPGG